MGSQLDPLPLSRVGSRERATKFQLPQLDFVKPSSWFHPVTWERVNYPNEWCGCCLLPLSRGSPQESHPNGTFSRDSQGGVPKLSRVGLLGLWELISPGSNLWLEWGLNQSCSSPRELFNALSHPFYRRWEEVDSWLLVVGSQTTNLTPGPSFAHNLGCRCPNGSCEAILDI